MLNDDPYASTDPAPETTPGDDQTDPAAPAAETTPGTDQAVLSDNEVAFVGEMTDRTKTPETSSDPLHNLSSGQKAVLAGLVRVCAVVIWVVTLPFCLWKRRWARISYIVAGIAALMVLTSYGTMRVTSKGDTAAKTPEPTKPSEVAAATPATEKTPAPEKKSEPPKAPASKPTSGPKMAPWLEKPPVFANGDQSVRLEWATFGDPFSHTSESWLESPCVRLCGPWASMRAIIFKMGEKVENGASMWAEMWPAGHIDIHMTGSNAQLARIVAAMENERWTSASPVRMEIMNGGSITCVTGGSGLNGGGSTTSSTSGSDAPTTSGNTPSPPSRSWYQSLRERE
jgi:uncharacterized membrane protein YuzA (DUF378 family)